jgi:uncharacterized damage-inducible protein DinB
MDDKFLRAQLVKSLEGEGAHISFEAAVRGFPRELIGRRLPNLAHTAWHLVYHIWIAQEDIIEYIRKPGLVSPEYPSGYWPKEDAPADPKEWGRKIDAIDKGLREFADWVRDPKADLFEPRPEGGDGSLLRAALLVIDHNSYHVGQLVDLRMLLGAPVRDW